MVLGLVGRKVGMTRIFAENGCSVPVTVLDMSANHITQIKTIETDGYQAIQVAFGEKRASRINKAVAGHYAKAGVASGRGLQEFVVSDAQLADLKIGDSISVTNFVSGQLVDVTGTSKGKGFSGTIKRHNFSGSLASHGNSRSHRVPGSIGQCQDPGRVFPGKKMSGQYGNTCSTVQCLEIVRVDTERQLLLVKGAVPGAKNGNVIVRASVKAGA